MPLFSCSSSGNIKQTIPSPFTRGFRAASAFNAALESLDILFLRKIDTYLSFSIVNRWRSLLLLGSVLLTLKSDCKSII